MLTPAIIEKTAPRQFKLLYPHLPEFELNMNFAPLIERFNLRGKFCLLHWQAKPFGLRRWGIYDGEKDSYCSTAWQSLEIKAGKIQCLQVDENIIKSVPTAVLYFPGCEISHQGFVSIN
ncbi:hypothetical protein [Kamptonema sp. UHCC 0994]|uniref:hypothetical protein n=1 Tax=Kamptonema sp. UHCC 0994 TaxID=3031329 RepID=UPI0023B965A4|nr:hypothetical protein [Kamptonema sp. UHCC 0994]MDF0553868.1 hypothetical protein [Kamptonema sp. UHCC 0994]